MRAVSSRRSAFGKNNRLIAESTALPSPNCYDNRYYSGSPAAGVVGGFLAHFYEHDIAVRATMAS